MEAKQRSKGGGLDDEPSPCCAKFLAKQKERAVGADTAPLVGTWVIGSARVSRRLKDREAQCLPYLPLLPHPSSEPKKFGK